MGKDGFMAKDKYMKMLLFLTTLFSFSLLYSEDEIHVYDVKSGLIIYNITGGTQLTPETNLSIVGNAKLCFKEWGDVILEEENGMVVTTGAIHYKDEVKRAEKRTKFKVITVDFENQQLLERPRSALNPNIEKETIDLERHGEAIVAGYPCEVWSTKGISKCIYKGIVLKQESYVMGVSYMKVAVDVNFDINTTEEECSVPQFPLQTFALIKDKIKTKNTKKVDNFCKVLKEASLRIKDKKNAVNLNSKERQKFINKLGKSIFLEQKKILPELLNALKETRACLQTGENPFEANECLKDFSRLKEQLGTDENEYIVLWDEKRKSKLLDKIEDELIYIQSRYPCINRSKNITDLSACMK